MTVREIASLTKLSSTTVHMALKHPNKVSNETLKKIKSIMEDVQRDPQRIREVYIVLSHINSFYTSFLIKVINLLTKENIRIIPFVTNENIDKERNFLSNINFSSRVGLIWNPVDKNAKFAFLKRKKNRPIIITLNRRLETYKTDLSIILSNKEASKMAVEALIKENNKNILFLNAPNNIITAKERSEGFLTTIRKYKNIKGDILLTDYNDWNYSYQILYSNKDKLKDYDAIISASELITYGVIKVLKNLNINIPRDIRLISFDSSATFEALSLSTVSFSPEIIAEHTSEFLMNKNICEDYKVEHNFLPKLSLLGSEKINTL